MPEPEKLKFSIKELCGILKECSRSGVAKLKFGELEVEFQKPTEKLEGEPLSPRALTEILAEQQKIHNVSLKTDEIRLKEQALAELPITDPLQYEELLMRGELTESDEEETR